MRNHWGGTKIQIAGLLVLPGAMIVVGYVHGRFSPRTSVQQGYHSLEKQGQAAATANVADPRWEAVAPYRQGDFERAASLFAGADTSDAACNQGNALVMLGRDDAAAERYAKALLLPPGWEYAELNLKFPLTRAKALEKNGGDMVQRITWHLVSGTLVALTLNSVVLFRHMSARLRRWQVWRTERRKSGSRYVRRAAASIRAGDPKQVLADTMRWLDCIHTGNRPARLSGFFDRYARPDEREKLTVLSKIAYPKSRLSDPARLDSNFRQVRKRRRGERKRSKPVEQQPHPLIRFAG